MMHTIDYQPGFLTGYSGGYKSLHEGYNFMRSFYLYSNGSIWQTAMAESALINKN